MKSLGIGYHMGIDGISLLLILLTTILTVLCILASWKSITTGVKGYFISMLLLTTGMIGVFCALDLFLFYVFWEVMLIPMYFIIGFWGGPRRVYAAIKFVLFTMFGSLLMLVGILYLYFAYHTATGEYTFDLLKITRMQIGVPAAALAVRRVRAGVCDQSAAVPVPYLAAGRPRSGADRRFGHSGGCSC